MITHFSGKEAVGSYIVANKEGFVKDKYRKFNIKSLILRMITL